MARKLGKIVGSRRSRRRGWLILACLGLVAGLMVVPIPGALAVHDTGVFQLDGNALTSVQSPVPALDDWDRVCREVLGVDCSTLDETSGATAVSFTAEPDRNATIFTGGGSKDPIDIDQWAWKDGAGGLPDKANLLNSFAVRYSLPDSAECPSGTAPTCEVLFFGSDRLDNSGDAVQGFWFFQNEITLGDQKLGGGTNFNGVHQDGDLLVISEFSNGGLKSTIVVYQWNSSVAGNLELLASSDAANCATVGPNDQFCGIVNAQDGTVAPWPFLDKSGNNTYLQGEFFEAGINLSTLGLADRCFASVSSETRTSTSTTSVLKDFVIGSFGNCETELVTTPLPGTSLSIGTGSVAVQDSAVLDVKGIPTWTGTLSFFLCGPGELDGDGLCTTGGTQIGSTINVNQGTPQPIVSASTNVTAAGDYCWRGFFDSGTDGVPDATDASAGECFTVAPVTPTISTQASAPVEIGNPISDTATLGGTANQPDGSAAGGSITFNVYGPNDESCAADPAFTSSVNVAGDGDYGSGDYTPTEAGTYYWVASYSGDLPNTLSVSGACGDANESVVVTPGQPAIVTNATPGPVPVGTAISDTATLTGTKPQADGAAAGGTITFNLYGPDDASCAGPVIFSATAGVSGDGDYGSGDYTPTEAGTYNWVASYSGDLPNTLSVSGACGDANEASVVDPLQPSITTNATAGPVPLGSAISDTATLSGTAPQTDGTTPAGGTITFNLYGPDDASCAGPVVFTSTATVSGDGDYGSGDYTPTAAGTYNWIASYSGDLPNTLSVSGSCGDANEASIVVQLQPTMNTAQQFVPNDSATITVVDPIGGDLAGTVVFELFVDDAVCAGAAAYTSDAIDIATGGGTGLSRTVMSSNTTAYLTSSSFAWVVTYTSANTAHKDVTSGCGNETSSITIDNGQTMPPATP